MAEEKKEEQKKASKHDCLLMHSGGPDSTTLLYDLLNQGKKPLAMHMITGRSGNDQEQGYAKNIADEKTVPMETMDMTGITNKFPKENMMCVHSEAKFIPFTNGIAYSSAASYAIYREIPEVYFALHAGDAAEHFMYGKEFLTLMNNLIEKNGDKCKIICPYMDMTKQEVIKKGNELKVPFTKTWSCYKCGVDETQCGECGACKRRRKTFKKLAIEDNTMYIKKDITYDE
eukprot:771840_1